MLVFAPQACKSAEGRVAYSLLLQLRHEEATCVFHVVGFSRVLRRSTEVVRGRTEFVRVRTEVVRVSEGVIGGRL